MLGQDAMLWQLIGTERIKFLLHVEHLPTHMEDDFDSGEVDAEIIDQAFDEADLLDVAIAVVAEVPRAPAWVDQPTPLIHSQALLVHATQFGRYFDRIGALVDRHDRVLMNACHAAAQTARVHAG